MAHTPTPWIAKNAGVFALAEDRNSEVARCLEGWGFDGAKDNAGFIIEAVNAYDSLKAQAALLSELVEAARAAHERLHQLHPSEYRIPVGKGICTWGPCERLREVLAKADAIMPKPAPVEGKVKP